MKKAKKILLLSLIALFINIIPINLVFSYGISTTSNYDDINADSVDSSKQKNQPLLPCVISFPKHFSYNSFEIRRNNFFLRRVEAV